MTIRWITPLLGTGPALSITLEQDVAIIDVRDLVDKAGNRPDAIKQKITEGCASLRAGKRTVVCCDYGISRSNAVAVGILATYESIPFEAAVRRVLTMTGEKEIKAEPLLIVRRALGDERNTAHPDTPRVLITGATGFLGQPLVERISNRFDITTPTRGDLDLLNGSTQLDLIAGEKDINCIVHLANPRIYTSNIAMGDTLTMLRNVIDVCIARDIRLIYMSSWEVYSGYHTSNLQADEALPLNPKGPYAETKYLCEMLIEHNRRTQGLRCSMLRSSPVYGSGSDKPKFIYNFIDKIQKSQRVVTHLYNNGQPALDLMYIDDLITAIEKMISIPFYGTLNIGTGRTTTTHKIAELLADIIGKPVSIDAVQIDSTTACIAMNTGKAHDVLGWKPTIDIKTGLELILRS